VPPLLAAGRLPARAHPLRHQYRYRRSVRCPPAGKLA
jgi:hypothetical protein